MADLDLSKQPLLNLLTCGEDVYLGVLIQYRHRYGDHVLEPNPLLETEIQRLLVELQEVFDAGRKWQRFHDTVTCASLATTRDPCGEVGTAFDCKRAIELGLTPTEAVRRIREGESFDD